MDTLVTPIFSSQDTEWLALQSGQVDLTDWALTPTLVSQFTSSPSFYVTPPISGKDYFELEFHLGTNMWGCYMNFGGAPCGKDIRQAIAHLVDKTVFTSTQADIQGLATPIDNPVPPSDGLVTPNPCAWDSMFPETGASCLVGATGGTSYHLAPATGVTYPWQPALGSPDFCAAADHLIHAGLATGASANVGTNGLHIPGTGTCVLTGISSTVANNPVSIFARSDDSPRLELGVGVAQEICALLTGSYATGCSPYLIWNQGPVTAFPGFTTSPTSVTQSWNIYTAGFRSVLAFDQSLFLGYNSRFVSGTSSIVAPNGPCSALAVPTFSAGDYYYLCDPQYDNLSGQMEFAPCLNYPGDPTPNQLSPTFANCPNTTQLTAVSAGYKAEDEFGQNSYTVPIWSPQNQYAYLSNWQRVVNHQGLGLMNYFGMIDGYSTNPGQAGTLRQGMKETTSSVNPYIAGTFWDFTIAGSVWDTLNTVNPLDTSQIMDWMTSSTLQLPNSQLGYSPPTGTQITYRFTLRNDIYWHDGKKVTTWDVAFSYLTLKAAGAFQASGASSVIAVKVLNPTQIDMNLNANGPFTRLNLTGLTIIPGRYWSYRCPGSLWDASLATNSMSNCLTVDPAKIQPSYDPVAAGTFIGSGPWVCKSSTGVVGIGCSSSGSQNPPIGGSYTLSRFGAGTVPGSSTNTFFRSSGTLALYAWSGDIGDFQQDFLNFNSVSHCYLLPLGTPGCTRWQQGIGSPGGSSTIGIVQINAVLRFMGVNWASPYNWQQSPPVGIASYPPVLYEGTNILNPASVAGCTGTYPNAGYDC